MDYNSAFWHQKDYPETGESQKDGPGDDQFGPAKHSETPPVSIEFVVVKGQEGEKLRELQSQAVRRVLTRLAREHRKAIGKED